MTTSIYTLTSPLHDKAAVDEATQDFLGNLGISYNLCGDDYSDYGCHALDLIFVRTGGTEGLFKNLLSKNSLRSDRPFYLLSSGTSNSLAAAIEILSFLRQQGLKGEILHGRPEYIGRRVTLLARAGAARHHLFGRKFGIIGAPSDWLIASDVSQATVKEKMGVDLVDIPIEELIDEIHRQQKEETQHLEDKNTSGLMRESLDMAYRIYLALKSIIDRHSLDGFTLRCFDLLEAVKNTGCLALAKLNAEGFVATCEGDIPAMLSMAISRAALGVSGFQANPARINPESGLMLFAHCTIPLNMVARYELDTHFESGIGVGIRGYMTEGPVTIFKIAGDLKRHYAQEGMLVRNQSKPDLCRTQQIIQLREIKQTRYFLTDPIGNHHIIIPSHCKELLDEICLTYQP